MARRLESEERARVLDACSTLAAMSDHLDVLDANILHARSLPEARGRLWKHSRAIRRLQGECRAHLSRLMTGMEAFEEARSYDTTTTVPPTYH